MKKRVLMIMLAAVMAFGLVACTGDAKDTKEKTKISRESEDEDDDEDDDEDKDSKKDKKKDKKDKKDFSIVGVYKVKLIYSNFSRKP